MAISELIFVLCLFHSGSAGYGNINGSPEFLNEKHYVNFINTASDNTDEKEKFSVTFRVYNRENPEGNKITMSSSVSSLKSAFIPKITTVLITHGWYGTENVSSVDSLRVAFMKTKYLNVVPVDWSHISHNEYVMTTMNVLEVGNTVGKMIMRLLDVGVTSVDHIYLIGHSLGAHVMGIAGSFIRDSGYGKVARITGLDPAGPFYEDFKNEDSRLDPRDGQFVDVIHTCKIFGYIQPLGQVDFFPNGGVEQPGCFPSLIISCSHKRSWQYFKESLYNERAFPAIMCGSYHNYTSNRCQNRPVAFMGYPTKKGTKGNFYLETNDAEPYGKGTI